MDQHRGIHVFDHIWQKVEVKTSNYTVTAKDTGKLMVANKAGVFTFTLPAVDDGEGCVWYFTQKQNQNLVITGGTTGKMVAIHNATADKVTFSTASQKIGAACAVMCDGSNYYFFNLGGCTATPS